MSLLKTKEDFIVEGVASDDELKEMLKSQWKRLNKLYYVINKKAKKVKFKPNFFQRLLLKFLHWRNVISKARQLGISTLIEIFILDYCLFHVNISAAIVADKADNGKKIFEKVLYAWDNLPNGLKEYLGIKEIVRSGSEIVWNNGSSVIVGTTIHSGCYQILHISELGPLCEESPDKAASVMQSALPTVPDEPGTYIFIESTARKEGDLFHLSCLEAQAATKRAELINPEKPQKALNILEYKFFFFPWWKSPEYKLKDVEQAKRVEISREQTRYFDELEKKIGRKLNICRRAWYVLKSKAIEREANATKNKMRAEYPGYAEEAFLSAGEKLFDQDIIQQKINTETRAPIEQIPDWKNSGGVWNIYKRYKPNHVYGAASDVSGGRGGHHTTGVFVDFTDNEIVAVYKGNRIEPGEWGQELARAGRWYGTCILAPENNFGSGTIDKLKDEYPIDRIYHFNILTGADPKETERLGWLTNTSNNSLAMGRLRSELQDEDNPLKCPDSAILYECLYYDKKDLFLPNTVKVQSGMTNHFDLLKAASIAVMMRDFAMAGIDEDSPQAKALIESRRARKRGYG